MNNKIFTLLIASGLMSVSAFSQTTNDNIDKLPKEKRDEMNAKADVLIQKRSRTIADSSATGSSVANESNANVSTSQEKVKSKKKRHHKHWKKKKKSIYK